MCYRLDTCQYWTWIPGSKTGVTKPTCNLKNSNSKGTTAFSGAYSGDTTCLQPTFTGNDSVPYQYFFPLFLTKSNKIHWKHAPNLTLSTITATIDSKLPI